MKVAFQTTKRLFPNYFTKEHSNLIKSIMKQAKAFKTEKRCIVPITNTGKQTYHESILLRIFFSMYDSFLTILNVNRIFSFRIMDVAHT